jgi:hypothetical protein
MFTNWKKLNSTKKDTIILLVGANYSFQKEFSGSVGASYQRASGSDND